MNILKKQKFKLSFTTFLVSLIVFLQAVAFIAAHKANQHDQAVKNYQINSLIGEIGELKTENDQLSTRLDEQGKFMTSASESLKKIENHYGTLQQEPQSTFQSGTETEIDINKLQQQIYALQALSQKALKAKDETIKELTLTQAEKEKILAINDKVQNILLLGENQGLTDTILLLSINPSQNKIHFISVPRDLYFKGRKINEYYQKYGVEELKSVLEDITALSIDHYIKINFDAFEEFVDSVGGVEVEIEKSIVDDQYPGPHNTYQTVTFEKGTEVLSGERALQYVRSRKSTSDFDRMERQQKLLKALKEKIKNLGVMNNLAVFTKVYQTLQKNMSTDLSLLDMLALFEQAKDFEAVKGDILSNQNFLYSTKAANGQYILLPTDSSFKAIQTAILKNVE